MTKNNQMVGHLVLLIIYYIDREGFFLECGDDVVMFFGIFKFSYWVSFRCFWRMSIFLMWQLTRHVFICF
ncbi:hypothetical protein HanRHA438_Chr04g0168491 [Helianthus annuus]|nr:hypothetical protein HanRHA438_Chr04g0168491 [Helianthus annuus]